ncbi:MAG: prolyl oligopeptidase family serine peptidase [Verrucomicrobiota bacterium]
MNRLKSTLSFLLIGLICPLAFSAESRLWTSTDGKTVEATFVKADGAMVTIRRKDGREFEVLLARLAYADQLYVGRQQVEEELGNSDDPDAENEEGTGTKVPDKKASGKGARVDASPQESQKEPLPDGDYSPLITGQWEKGTFKDMPFQIFGGRDFHGGTTYPLVFYLHSANARGVDNEKQMEIGARSFAYEENFAANPCFIVAPQCPKEAYWRAQARDQTLDFLRDLIRQLPVDRDRVYLTGHSMGGSGTFAFITESPQLFAAAVPVSGAGDEKRIRRFKRLPLWIFHGGSDSHVNVVYSRNMVEALKKARGLVKYTEYERMGHRIGDEVYQTPELHEWLFQQVRGGGLDSVTAKMAP